MALEPATVTVEPYFGAQIPDEQYSDPDYLAAEAAVSEAVTNLIAAGATSDNVAAAVAIGISGEA